MSCFMSYFSEERHQKFRQEALKIRREQGRSGAVYFIETLHQQIQLQVRMKHKELIRIPRAYFSEEQLQSIKLQKPFKTVDVEVRDKTSLLSGEQIQELWRQILIKQRELRKLLRLLDAAPAHVVQRQLTQQTRSCFRPRLFDCYIDGEIGNRKVRALPDTGAQFNIISAELAYDMGMSPQPNTEKDIQMPSGNRVASPGSVQVPFTFLGESQTMFISCLIMPRCSHGLILSGRFLRATKTLTKFGERIKKVCSDASKRLRLQFLGGERQRLWGQINDDPVLALPDTGSDIMLIDSAYAEFQDFSIDDDPDNHLELVLADGTLVVTSGIVRDIEWSFGDDTESVICSFYVLDDLGVDVVLSKDFVFEFDVFSQFEENIVEVKKAEERAELNNIRLIGKYSQELRRLEESYMNDVNSADPFSDLRVQIELQRRDEIEEHIRSLDDSQQEAAWRDETERQRRWEALRQLRQQHTGNTCQNVSTPGKGPHIKKSNRWRLFRWPSRSC